jgi:hypothetical protein
LSIKRKIDDEIENFQKIAAQRATVEQKLDELITLLGNTNLDSEQAKIYQKRIDQAIKQSTSIDDQVKSFQEVGDNKTLTREEMLDRMGMLLSEHNIDSDITKQYNRRERVQAFVTCLIGITMIILGFAMIIMPAPPSFEIYTVFYFSENDGVTIMDLVSLLIILCGVFLVVVSINKFRRRYEQ